MHDAVDEQGRSTEHLAGGEPALDVAADPREHARAGAVGVEALEVKPELGRIRAQVGVLERLLAMEEQLVHLPEPTLDRGGRGGRGGERVRVDVRQREVAEREADLVTELRLDALDLPERAPGVRALVVAALDDQAPLRPAADVIDGRVKLLHGLFHRTPA